MKITRDEELKDAFNSFHNSKPINICRIDPNARPKEVSKYLVKKRIKNLIQLWSFSGAP